MRTIVNENSYQVRSQATPQPQRRAAAAPYLGAALVNDRPIADPGSEASRALIGAIRDELWRVREPARAAGQQRYMKSSMPFMGVRVPLMRKTARAVFDRHPPAGADQWRATVRALWHEAQYREERHAAVELALHRPFLRWLTMDSVPLLEELIVAGAWWDYVDRIAPAGLGHVLAAEPEPMGATMRVWARDENIWRRRAALLCQLGSKKDTDLVLLYDCIEASMGHREFFVQKAMGWALRDYARTDPGEVRRYVAANEARLPTLTRREATKNLA